MYQSSESVKDLSGRSLGNKAYSNLTESSMAPGRVARDQKSPTTTSRCVRSKRFAPSL